MATKRRPIHSQTNMNFRPGGPELPRTEAKGTRPTAKPTSVKEVIVMMLMHVCKKTIFFDTNLKVALYLGSLFLISLIGDFLPFPKTYFSRSDNMFNVYFVKIGWAWTLVFSGSFLFMTSYTLCCGDINKIIKHHLPRIVIATGFWFVWTKLFNIIETSFGRCTARSYDSKVACLKAGYFWQGFDISGHAFILIYSSLVLIEEAKPIIKWECIKDYIRNELHNRNTSEYSSNNPLRNLSDIEIKTLKNLYEKYTPLVRGIFIGMTILQLLWDIMLVSTMLYYHRMIEKVLSGIIAILTWFFTYKAWYPSPSFLPDTPGSGNFIYQNEKIQPPLLKRTPSLSTTNPNISRGGPGPKFMGMPIYTAYTRNQQQQQQQQQQQAAPSSTTNNPTDLVL